MVSVTRLKHLLRSIAAVVVLQALLLAANGWAEEPNTTRHFTVAPNNLSQALLEFAQQAQLQLLIDPKDLKNKHSQGVEGIFSPIEALVILLGDAPLGYELLGDRTLVIRAQQNAARPLPDHQYDGKQYVLEEILVTSRRVLEDLQKTPVAVSAFNQHNITMLGAQNLAEISGLAPNVHFEPAASIGGLTNAPTVFIRAIGQADFLLTSDPAVGVYLDGVNMPGSIGSLVNLTDISRVEVLRGPQGTLFGRNSIGGAINLITRKPHDELAGELSATLGSDHWRTEHVALNLPLASNLYAGLSAQRTQWDGWVEASQYDDYHFGEKNEKAARLALRWLASDTLTIDFSADITASKEAPAPFYSVNASDLRGGNQGPFPGSDSARFNETDPAAIDANCATSVLARQTNPACIGAVWTQSDPFKSDAVFFDTEGNKIKPDNELDVWGLGLTLEWGLEQLQIKSITGYREVNASFINDLDQTPHPIFQNVNSGYDNQSFSQEFQASGSALQQRLDYIAGLYYFEEKGLQNVLLQRQGDSKATYTSGPGFIFSDDNRTTENSSIAAFVSTTWHPRDWLHLTAGLRWTDNTKQIELDINRPKPRPLSPSQRVTGEDSFTETDPLLTLGMDISDSTYSYLTYSEGFRDGGFPTRFVGNIAKLEPFDSESVQSLEVGIKSTLLDSRLRFNLALFHTQYDNFQVVASPAVSDSTVTVTENLSGVEFNGLELELFWLASQYLKFDFSLGWLDNRIKNISGEEISSIGFTITESNELPYSPRWNWNLGISKKWPLASGDEFEARIDWRYVDDQHFRIENPVDLQQQAYSTVNVNMAYRFAGGNWELQLGAKNLSDEVYSTAGAINNPTQLVVANIARPRSYYAMVRYFFGE